MIDLDNFYRRYLSCCNERRLGDLATFVHDEIRFNGRLTALADYAAAIASNVEAVPDFHWTIEDLVVNHNTIAVRLTDTGTPQQDWLGIASTGKSIEIAEFAFYRVRDGKIGEMWFALDERAARTQLSRSDQHG